MGWTKLTVKGVGNGLGMCWEWAGIINNVATPSFKAGNGLGMGWELAGMLNNLETPSSSARNGLGIEIVTSSQEHG